MPPAYRRDFATIGLEGYAWQLWGCTVFNGCLDCGRMGPVVEAAVSLGMAPFCL